MKIFKLFWKKHFQSWISSRIWCKIFSWWKCSEDVEHVYFPVQIRCYSAGKQFCVGLGFSTSVYLDGFKKKKKELGQYWVWNVLYKSITCSHLENYLYFLSLSQKTFYIQDLEKATAVSQFLERFVYEKRPNRISLEKRSKGCIVPLHRILNCKQK